MTAKRSMMTDTRFFAILAAMTQDDFGLVSGWMTLECWPTDGVRFLKEDGTTALWHGASVSYSETPLTLYVDPVPEKAGPFTVTLKGDMDDAFNRPTDYLTGRAVLLDLDVDADNDGAIGEADDPLEENPGGILATGTVKQVALRLAPAGLTGTLKLLAVSGGSHIRLWRDAGKTSSLALSDAEWELSGGYTFPTALYVEGIEASAAVRDVHLCLRYTAAGGQYVDDYIRLTVLSVDIKKVEFTSDHGVLTDYNTDYAGSGGTVYNPRGWIKGGANNPITHVKGSKITANVTFCVQPSGITFDLSGDGPIDALDFYKTGLTSSGSDQTVSITSDAEFPARVDVLEESVAWSIDVSDGPSYSGGSSGPHKIYATWGSPGSGPTLKRVDKVCHTAWWQNSPESIADSLHDMVASQTTFGSGGVDGWVLLDGGSGDCDNQARCMKYTFEMLGAGAANVRLVRASTNSGQGNCLALESRVVNNQTHYLIIDFDAGAGYNWNAYEGCCEAAFHYYAITPKEKEDHDYDLLKALGCQQYWVRTTVPPGSPGWSVVEVFEEVSVP